ncbi:SDR family NAD(P)-dependent oxidoreductase [Alloalcanivorax mobilis]|uniref:SDR family NAD(P)-dependent oxidoreductase n=1 Tax=Alloalcanivorax mobilis TaxID=2019569 RepID=UPI000C7617B8|nr:glucose 1-dehydrogenase [Alloalcanivorax mobilis]
MDPLLDFTDKVAVITGAASGFGKLLARELGVRGARVVIGDINAAELDKVAADLEAQGISAAARCCDVSSEEDCRALVDTAVQLYGRLDLAINNAGIAHGFVPIHELTGELLDQQINVNVKGVMYGMKYQIAAMKNNGGGAIVNTSSMAGLGAAPKIGAYAAAKHAVIGLTRTAAVEYGRKNIRVNAVCPYYTLTPMLEGNNGLASDESAAQTLAMMAAGSPMKRVGQPEEIVAVMMMLLSPANTYMNGQAIAVDGGVSAF